MESMRWVLRVGVAGAVVLVLMVGLMMIRALVSERAGYRDQAVARVAASRAGEQVVTGPLRVVPYVELRPIRDADPGQEPYRRVTGVELQMPLQLQAAGQLQPERRRVGQFDVSVYSLKGKLEARFAAWQPPRVAGRSYGEPFLMLGLSDVRGLIGSPALQVDGRAVLLKAGSGALQDVLPGVHVPLSLDADGGLPASRLGLELVLDGTRSLGLVPVADDTRLALQSSWPSPSFGGAFSPLERSVSDQGFQAQWAVSSLATQAQSQLRHRLGGQGGAVERIELSLIDPVDVYTLAERATKYGVLFIVLTFVGFGIYDLVRGLGIHPVQYLLVGLALTLFFLLLLGLTEKLPFWLAYLLASTGCIGLQAWYLAGVLGSGRRALGLAATLTVLYGALYGLLVSEGNALLLGSLLLFAVLAAVMGLTRRLDWRHLGQDGG